MISANLSLPVWPLGSVSKIPTHAPFAFTYASSFSSSPSSSSRSEHLPPALLPFFCKVSILHRAHCFGVREDGNQQFVHIIVASPFFPASMFPVASVFSEASRCLRTAASFSSFSVCGSQSLYHHIAVGFRSICMSMSSEQAIAGALRTYSSFSSSFKPFFNNLSFVL